MSEKLRLKSYVDTMPALAVHVGMPAPSNFDSVDAYLPYLERMQREGCSVTLKIDGLRPGKNQYPAVASGGLLSDDGAIRTDAPGIVVAAAYVVVSYARACWGFRQ